DIFPFSLEFGGARGDGQRRRRLDALYASRDGMSHGAPNSLDCDRARLYYGIPIRGTTMTQFRLRAEYRPAGDQPLAIERLTEGLQSGLAHQTLLGVTGSGKTFSVAAVIERIQRPTLVLAHNKTLAAQLYGEFREFFPENAVEYFVSYYDYYQPE